MTAALELAVARQIGEFELDVAFTVESGMSVLFGPSGAGKSLTLALIAGLMRPDTGTIAINGQVVTDCSRRTYVTTQKRRIGMVFQDGLLLPHRSALDNVALAVRQASGRGAAAGVRPRLARTGRSGGVRGPPTGFPLGWPAPASGAGTWACRGPGTCLARRAALSARLRSSP